MTQVWVYNIMHHEYASENRSPCQKGIVLYPPVTMLPPCYFACCMMHQSSIAMPRTRRTDQCRVFRCLSIKGFTIGSVEVGLYMSAIALTTKNQLTMEVTSGSSGFGVSIRSYIERSTIVPQWIPTCRPGHDWPVVIFVDGFHWSVLSIPKHKLSGTISRVHRFRIGEIAYFPSLSILGWYIFVLNLIYIW